MSNRYAIIENNLVTNVVVADAEYAQEQGWTSCPAEVGPGWTLENGVFTAPVIPEPIPAPQPTKEQLMAELQALAAKIQAME